MVLRGLFILSILFSCPAIGQITIKGTLLENGDRSPIAYANLGILNSSIGTISNADGSFELTIPEVHRKDSLLVAALGYNRKSVYIPSIADPCIIYLDENVTVLHNITVKSKKIKPAKSVVLGNRFYNASSIYFDSISGGSAMALLIENKPPNHDPELRLPYYITNAKIRISHNAFDKLRIRIRFLSPDSLGLPGIDLTNNNIIVNSSITKGWLSVDLTKYNIVITKPRFFLVVEWLVDEEDRVMLREQYAEFQRQFPQRVTTDTIRVEGETLTINNWIGLKAGTSFGSSSLRVHQQQYRSFFRNNSYGQWRRSSFVLAASVTVSNYAHLPR
jgi:hypothetical protein